MSRNLLRENRKPPTCSKSMPAQTQRALTVETPFTGFPINVCFNQFSVERTEIGSLVTVGYLAHGRLLDEVFSFSILAEALQQTREATLEYLGRTGEMTPVDVVPVRPAARVLPVNMISMSHRAEVAETLLHNFAFRLTLAEARQTSFDAEPVALLISPVNVQRHLIRALYSTVR